MIVLVAGAALVSGCAKRLPSYRYRLTVEVQTPEGIHVGSSVIQVDTYQGTGIPDKSISSRISGQAVMVDLGNRGKLFALLSSVGRQIGAGGYAWALLPEVPNHKYDYAGLRENYQALKDTKGEAELAYSQYPTLVRFRNIANPATVEWVDQNDLAASFGAGVELHRITVSITDDKVTKGIESTFPWWKEYLKKHFDGTSTISVDVRDQDPAARLSSGSFSTEA